MSDLSLIAPIGMLSLAALGLLLLEVCLPQAWRKPSSADRVALARARVSTLLAVVAGIALLVTLYTSVTLFMTRVSGFFGPREMLSLDPLSSFAMALIALGALFSIGLSITYLPAIRVDAGEYYALLLLSTTGMFVVVSAVDLIALFLGLELMALPLHALAGFDKRKLRSNEAALKSLLLGGVASAFFLYGTALLYGATGHTDFEGIALGFASGGALAQGGFALVLVALLFRLAVFPFHQWMPDVYQGAPSSLSAFVAATVATAGLVALARFLVVLPASGMERVETLLSLLSAATMLVGALMAVIQTNVKRMLAYAGIAHVGALLMGLIAATPEAFTAMLFYLFVQLVLGVGAFGVLVSLCQAGRECESIDDFAGLATRRPGIAATMTLFVLAGVGAPGTAGFMAKFHLFAALIGAERLALVGVAVFTSVVLLFAMLRLPVAMYMRTGSTAPAPEPSSSELLVLAICVAATVYFGFFSSADPMGTGVRAMEIATRAARHLS